MPPSDATNTAADTETQALTAAPVAPETLLQKIEDNFETEVGVLETDAKVEVEKISALFSADVWPYVKAGILTLLTVGGKAAMQAEVAAIPLEVSGNLAAAAGAVGAAITGAVASNAEGVAETEGEAVVEAVEADANATDGEKALAAEAQTLIPGSQAATNGASGTEAQTEPGTQSGS